MGSCASSKGLAPLLVVLGLLWGGAGGAQEPQRETFEQVNAHGLAAYEAHRYEEALAEFQAAYALRQLPGVLYNIAQTHRRLGQAREAKETYELYLRADGKADAQTQARVRGYIEQMRALIEGAAGKTAEIAIVPPVPETEPAPAALVLVPDVGSDLQRSAPPPRPVYKRWWFWTSIGAAALTVVGVGVGLGLGLKPGSAVSVPSDNQRQVTF